MIHWAHSGVASGVSVQTALRSLQWLRLRSTRSRYSTRTSTVPPGSASVASRRKKLSRVPGRFWNGPIQNYWNEIAQTAARSRHLPTAESARLFALLDLTIADAVIAF